MTHLSLRSPIFARYSFTLTMKSVQLLLRLLIGGLFVFSGLIKLNDPIGTAIKLQEYFDVFDKDLVALAGINLHGFWQWLGQSSTVLSVIICVLEVVLGIALLIGYRLRQTLLALLGLIVFFTFLTFYSAYFNKVTDCGCFGDAIKLAPWESFAKDVVLLVLLLVLAAQWKQLDAGVERWKGMVTGMSTLLATAVALYALAFLPFIDFRAYKQGAHLPTLMKAPPAQEPCRYQYFMQKDGKEFVFDQYPTDTTYKFVRMTIPNEAACMPKAAITDFNVSGEQGENMTDSVMVGRWVFFIVQDPAKTDAAALPGMARLAAELRQEGVRTAVLSKARETQALTTGQGLDMPFYLVDEKVLKTIMRSDPGIWALQDGTVVEKWHHNSTPAGSEIKKLWK